MSQPTSISFRALCAELANYLQGRKDLECGWGEEDPEQDLLDRTRAALAQPEPEGPTDEELLGCMLKAAASVPGGQCTGILDWDKEAIAAARAVLARYARPAIKPVPTSQEAP
jgi:hypothetical protein